jgi:signal transduction histidine kinase
MRQATLRVRLTATTAVATAIAVGLLILGVQLLLARSSETAAEDLLHARADAAAATVKVVDSRVTVLDPPANSLDENLWIYDASGNRIDGSTPGNYLRTHLKSLSKDRTSRVFNLDRYRLLTRPVRDHGEVVAVVVAGVDWAPYESAERRGLLYSLALGLAAVLAAGAAAWISASYSLRQVSTMARRADDWREHDLTGRFDLGRPRDELSALGQTLDSMLERIEQALLSERRLTDELAHELRTPLTAIRSEAELALNRPHDAAEADAMHSIVAATRRMEAAIATMLAVARSHDAGPSRASAADLVTRAVAGAPQREDVIVEGSTVGDPSAAAPDAVVLSTLGPIVDNAVRHARSRVRVSALQTGRRVRFEVYDDGPGVPEDRRESIFEAGFTTSSSGSGLGLPLARRLAHSAGGQVRIEGDGHGLVVVEFPAT